MSNVRVARSHSKHANDSHRLIQTTRIFPGCQALLSRCKTRRPRASCQTNCLIRISVALFRGELNTALIRRHRRWLFIATRRERFSRPDRNIVGMER